MSSQKLFPEGLLGRKVGMSQVFADDGSVIPVTCLEVGPCFVLDYKTNDEDGYSSVKLGFLEKKAHRVSKPAMGQFKEAGKGAFYHVKEIRCDGAKLGWNEAGKEITVDQVFTSGQEVDVTGTSIGRGFQGVFKRHNMKGQPATRGTHEVRRHVGSIGCRKTPGRVMKNKRMPGHMGHEKVTMQNLTIVAVDTENNLILVKGGVPGPKGGIVTIKKAVKSFEQSAA